VRISRNLYIGHTLANAQRAPKSAITIFSGLGDAGTKEGVDSTGGNIRGKALENLELSGNKLDRFKLVEDWET